MASGAGDGSVPWLSGALPARLGEGAGRQRCCLAVVQVVAACRWWCI